jgi:hypothetical protein
MNQNVILEDDSEGFLENVDEGILIPFGSCRMIETKDSALDRDARNAITKHERIRPDYWDFEKSSI